ncbi:hypothetical protein DFP94_10947 [Fontibacillus phaseoli]|uniref:Butirosin biosynthesis protein H-like n=1 Tax=Fontibacillus phaseoli TaxID=1416533 RepID=A0A369B735_9BACL|nr:hypothetical protein [Fontibacillus phaseoli]RCX17323.1 hypothetical protein DFP94_10947 [Fontibacillus phaseoli]
MVNPAKVKVMTKPELVNIGPLECAASCMATWLNMHGQDYRLFVANYWNVHYEQHTLITSRTPNYYNMDSLYGMAIRADIGRIPDLITEIREGNGVMFICNASGLFYFPRNILTFESVNAKHCVLVYDYNEQTGKFAVIDPIAEFCGEVAAAELEAASVMNNEMLYFSVGSHFDDRSRPLGDKLAMAAERNWISFDKPYIPGGKQALEILERDIETCSGWSEVERKSWVDRNNISIMVFHKLRPMIWESFVSFGQMKETSVITGGEIMEDIKQLWRSLNLCLIRLGRKSDDPHKRETCLEKVAQIKASEMKFLKFLYNELID